MVGSRIRRPFALRYRVIDSCANVTSAAPAAVCSLPTVRLPCGGSNNDCRRWCNERSQTLVPLRQPCGWSRSNSASRTGRCSSLHRRNPHFTQLADRRVDYCLRAGRCGSRSLRRRTYRRAGGGVQGAGWSALAAATCAITVRLRSPGPRSELARRCLVNCLCQPTFTRHCLANLSPHNYRPVTSFPGKTRLGCSAFGVSFRSPIFWSCREPATRWRARSTKYKPWAIAGMCAS